MGWMDIFKRRDKRQPVRVVRFPRSRSRSFSGASTGRLLSGWTTMPQMPDAVIRDTLPALRARSRDSYFNNDFVRRFVGMVRTNVIGPRGVALQARSTDDDGELDRLANAEIERGWQDWGRAEHCDCRQQLTWVEMQRQAITTLAIDGEILARKITGPSGGQYGYRLQHLDTELLDSQYNDVKKGDGFIRMGIEFDGWKRPVAYHLRDVNHTDVGYYAANGKRYVRVPAQQIIHAFLPDLVDLSRGYPLMSTAMVRLKMLEGYFDAALTAARAGASKMGFITTPTGDEYDGDEIDSDGSVISDFEAGIIEELAEGQDFTAFDPKYPHEQFDDFVKSCLRSVAGSLGVAYSGLSNDIENANYSSMRYGALDEREVWKTMQDWFVDSYCRPAFEGWLSMALLSGQLSVTGRPLKVSRENKYRSVAWQPRRWGWVDPQKDMAANVQAIENNITTVSAVIRDQGRDPDEVFQERAMEIERMDELGLSTAVMVGAESKDETDGSEQD